jgi:hypothetical protein
VADTTSSKTDIDNARTLLSRIPALQRPCDLDLLVFFARHWRALLSTEQLARLLGYPLKEIARSRDALVAAGFLTRAQDKSRPERMYVFEPEGMADSPLEAIVSFASTPDGRLSLRRALMPVAESGRDDAPTQRRDRRAAPRRARPDAEMASSKRRRSSEGETSEHSERTE